MSDWRETASRHLPQFRAVIEESASHVDLWQNLKEMLSDAGVIEARRPIAQAIYDYAWWCFAESGDQHLSAEVETFFYEDLSVYSDFEEQLPRFIAPAQFRALEGPFSYRLSEEEYDRFRVRYWEMQSEDG